MPELPKLLEDIQGNLPTHVRSARERAEEIVFGTNQLDKNGNPVKPKKPQPDEQTSSVPAIKKIFDTLKKQSSYTIDDSVELNALAQLLFHKAANQHELNQMVIDGRLLDPEYDQLSNRIDKQMKAMKMLRDTLGMTHMTKLKKVVDLAKLLIEEEKAKQQVPQGLQVPPKAIKIANIQKKQKVGL